jgi:hypothetical protein
VGFLELFGNIGIGDALELSWLYPRGVVKVNVYVWGVAGKGVVPSIGTAGEVSYRDTDGVVGREGINT